MELEKTFALIKPEAFAAGNEASIRMLIEGAGLQIVGRSQLQLTKLQAEEFCANEDKATRPQTVAHLTSGPTVALSLAGIGAVERLLALLGPADPSVARDEAPASLRARFGTSSRHNACHGSASALEAAREIRLFFPTVAVNLDSEASLKYLREKHACKEPAHAAASPVDATTEGTFAAGARTQLQPTLIRALTAFSKEHPSDDPLEAAEWLADWLARHNPNTAKVLAAGQRPFEDDPCAVDVDERVSAAEEELAALQVEASAPAPAPATAEEFENLDSYTAEDQAKITKIQATARGHLARKQTRAKAVTEPPAATVPDDGSTAAAVDDVEATAPAEQAG